MQGEQALGVRVRMTIKKLHPILFQNPFLGFRLSVPWINKTAGVSEEILNGIVIVIFIVLLPSGSEIYQIFQVSSFLGHIQSTKIDKNDQLFTLAYVVIHPV